MEGSKITIVSVLLAITAIVAMNTGHYLLGAVAMILNGALILYTSRSTGKKIQGAVALLFGLYILAKILGFLIHLLT